MPKVYIFGILKAYDMRVILDLDETVLETLQKQAEAQNRSRKNYMETVLSNLSTSIPRSAYIQQEPFPKGIQDLIKPTNQIKPYQPATTNYSINTEQIAADEAELLTLPTTGDFAIKRRKFLNNRIKELKKQQ